MVSIAVSILSQGELLFRFSRNASHCQYSMKNTSCRNGSFNHCATRQITRGVTNQQGDMHKFIVKRETMTHELLFAQVLTMIGADNQESTIQPAARAQFLQECTHQLILSSYLGIVHAIEHHLVIIGNSTDEWSKPAKNVAVEMAQVAL